MVYFNFHSSSSSFINTYKLIITSDGFAMYPNPVFWKSHVEMGLRQVGTKNFIIFAYLMIFQSGAHTLKEALQNFEICPKFGKKNEEKPCCF